MLWKMEKIVHNHGFLLFVLLSNHRKLCLYVRILPPNLVQSYLFRLKPLGTFACEFITAEKSTINVSGFIAGVKRWK